MRSVKNHLIIYHTAVLLLYAVTTKAQTTTSSAPRLRADNIAEVIAAMTTEEKALFVRGANSDGSLPAGHTNAVPRLGIPAMVMVDGPAGVRIDAKRKGDTKTYYCTAFPIETLLASTWDTETLYEVGKAMGNEAHEYGADILLAPALNIHRNPLGGRNFEYYSEDPLISGKMAAAMVNGVQSEGIGTSIKHFAANNQETNRFKVNAVISERALREIYLQGFKIALQGSSPWTVMSSYNKINGTYTSERKDLLYDILRKEWNFKRFVMSDWRGGFDAVAQMKATNDLLMPGKSAQSQSIDSALRNGKLDTSVVNANIRRILEVVVQSPVFKKYQYSNNPDLKLHAQTSRESATAGMVLLKNQGTCLPIAKTVKNIALFGNTSYNLLSGGTGSGEVNKAYVISLVSGIKTAGYQVCDSILKFYQKGIALARLQKQNPRGLMEEITVDKALITEQCKQTDLAVITLGRISGESNDRKITDFDLSAAEKELLRNVTKTYHQAGKKVIVVLNIGGVIETASWKSMPDAILLAWQPGQEAGYAIADILTGKVNPSGKLATTFPVDYADVPSAKNFPGTPDGKTDQLIYQEGIYVGYRYYDTFNIPTSYEFGYGLSFTGFSYSKLKLSSSVFNKQLAVSVLVKNTGKMAGREIAQLYLSAPTAKIDKPVKELKGFAKTRLLQPGETQLLTFNLSTQDLASFYSSDHIWLAQAGKYTVSIGASSRNIRQTGSFNVTEDIIAEKVHEALIPQERIEDLRPKKSIHQ
jgi:beta-glucosidase